MRRYMMAIYNTYKDAVLANGSTKGVVTTCEDWTGSNWFEGKFTFETKHERPDVGNGKWKKCNPADYLETLESFLASGKRLADGDRYIENDGEVVPITSDGDEKSVSEFAINTPRKGDENLFILQAAADQVETPKKKGAFDAMTDTAPQQVESLGKAEWENGDKCLWDEKEAVFVGFLPSSSSMCVIQLGNPSASKSGVIIVDDMSELSKPETPEEREERERLEAAYYLYCKCGIQHETVSFEKFKADDDCYPCVWLDIVDETSYRKERK